MLCVSYIYKYVMCACQEGVAFPDSQISFSLRIVSEKQCYRLTTVDKTMNHPLKLYIFGSMMLI